MTSDKRPNSFLIAALLVMAAAMAWWFLRPGIPAPPQPDLSGSETRVAEKLTRLSQAVNADNDNPDVWGRLGSMYLASGFDDEALDCFAVAMQLSPRDFRWPYLSGYSLRDRNPDAALTNFESAERLNDKYAALYLRKGDLLLRLDRSDEAAAEYRHSLDLDPRSSHARLGLARIALLENRPEEALDLLHQALQLQPGHWEVARALAQTYSVVGNDEEARRLNSGDRPTQVLTEPDDPVVAAVWQEAVDSNTMLVRGADALFSGNSAQAVAAFEEVVALRPDSSEHHRWLADAYAASGRGADAQRSYKDALAIDPESIPALMGLGAIQLATNQLQQAIRNLQHAVELDDSDATANFLLGSAREANGETGLAAQSYHAATTIDATLTPAWAGLARTSEATDYETAVTAWGQVVEQAPANRAARQHLVRMLLAGGQYAAAIAALQRGLEIYPDDVDASRQLAWELATAPDPEVRDAVEARRLAEFAFAKNAGNPLASDTLAAALAENGIYTEAAALAETALGLLQENEDELRGEIIERRDLYLANKPYRQTVPQN